MSYAKLGIHIVRHRTDTSAGEVVSRHRTAESSASSWRQAINSYRAVHGAKLRLVDTHDGSVLKEWP